MQCLAAASRRPFEALHMLAPLRAGLRRLPSRVGHAMATAAMRSYILTPLPVGAEVRGVDLKAQLDKEVMERINEDVTRCGGGWGGRRRGGGARGAPQPHAHSPTRTHPPPTHARAQAPPARVPRPGGCQWGAAR